MCRVTRPGRLIGVYLWDHGGGMELIHRFWEVAVERDPAASDLDAAGRFPLCRQEALRDLFDDGGPAPSYVASVSEEDRADLRSRLRNRLTRGAGGSIALTARAWAARGTVPN